METGVFQFNDPIDFLCFELERRKAKNPRYSIRAWSRQLQFKNPAFLAQILQRKRKLKIDLAKKIGQQMNLKSSELRYFEALVLLANAKSSEEKTLLYLALENTRADSSVENVNVTLDLFRFISDWTHVAILEIFNLKEFGGTEAEICSMLAPLCTPGLTKKNIERLVRLGLILRSKNGRLKRASESRYLVDAKIPSEAVRSFHAQMIQKALDSVEGQKFTQRDLRASTVTLRAEDLEEARKILCKAHEKITKLSRRGDGLAIYQLNTQLFNLIPHIEGDIQ